MATQKNISARIDGQRLGLGWLDGLTMLDNRSAVSTKWHTHPNMEILFLLKGEMHYELDASPMQTVTSGTFFVIPQNLRHRAFEDIGEPAVKLGMNVKPASNRKSPFALFSPHEFQSFRDELLGKALRPLPCSRAMLAIVKQLLSFAEQPQPADALTLVKLRADCCELFCACAQICRSGNAFPRTGGMLMEEAVRFLEERYAGHVSIGDLISHMGYGRTQLYTLFKRQTGITPNDYLLRFRIRQAQKFLTETDWPVEKISRQTGFSSAQYFCETFKRFTGYRPGRYRLEKKGQEAK
jgi:AraC-like DNA-binding protein/mannose-6-phosphate isomerase-like protein (cupin superfamily)